MKRFGAVVGAALAVCGCGTEPGSVVDHEAPPSAVPLAKTLGPDELVLQDAPNLLARVKMGPRHALEFYAVGEGMVGYSEVGTYAELPTKLLERVDLDDPVAVFNAVAPGTAMPPRLERFLAGDATAVPTNVPAAALVSGPEAANDRSQIAVRTGGLAARPRTGGVAADATLSSLPAPEPASTKALTSTSDVEVSVGALSSETAAGGQPNGTCPASLFPSISGPLGPFCPTTGDFPWCHLNFSSVFVDAFNIRTRRMLGTACVDAGGTAQFTIDLMAVGGTPFSHNVFFQVAGTWRQWLSNMGCQYKWLIVQTCDNVGMRMRVDPVPGSSVRVQFGGTWHQWL
jgi:hypothetical protein